MLVRMVIRSCYTCKFNKSIVWRLQAKALDHPLRFGLAPHEVAQYRLWPSLAGKAPKFEVQEGQHRQNENLNSFSVEATPSDAVPSQPGRAKLPPPVSKVPLQVLCTPNSDAM